QRSRVELDVAGRVGGDARDVVDALELHGAEASGSRHRVVDSQLYGDMHHFTSLIRTTYRDLKGVRMTDTMSAAEADELLERNPARRRSVHQSARDLPRVLRLTRMRGGRRRGQLRRLRAG